MSTRIDGAACQIIPDDLYTSGEPSLNRLAAAAGDRFDVWQRQINRIILAKSADGFWSARNAVTLALHGAMTTRRDPTAQQEAWY